MSADWKPGDLAIWTRNLRGGYGYTEQVPVEIVSVGPKRVRVRGKRLDGQMKIVAVMADNLRRREP